MPFEPVETRKLSDSVVNQIERLILRGVLRPGERLPSEREIAELMKVSRPSVREAIQRLQQRGLVIARPGSGNYVADLVGQAFAPPLLELFAGHDDALFDFVDFRRDIEGLAAARAATHGTDADHRLIDEIFRRMEAAHARRSARREAELDAEFHLAIMEASHNVVMLHMMRSVFELLRRGVFYNRQAMFRQRTTRAALLDQHRAVRDAILERDAETARKATEAHLDYIREALMVDRRMARNARDAELKLQRLGSRRA